MSDNQMHFSVQSIAFPRIDFTFLQSPTTDKFGQGFRVSVLIVADDLIRVLFGIKLTSAEMVAESTPANTMLVEAIADIKLSTGLKKISKITEIPLFANMLAVMYPFLREKVAYCFLSNNFTVLLPPLNTHDLVLKHGETSQFDLVDSRIPPEGATAPTEV